MGKHKANKFILGVVLLFAILWTPVYAIDGDDLYCLYKGKDFQGQELCGAESASWLSFSWHRKTSSLKVKQGYELVTFPNIGYWGQERIFSGDNTELGNWNNRIGSFYARPVQTEQQKACFYTRKNYKGRRFCTTEDQLLFPWYWDDRISSVSIPSGFQVTLYKRWFYRGNTLVLTASTPNLGNFNNKTSSLQIEEVTQTIDIDGDGIEDSVDLCPETPLGEVVNDQGCALSQLDTDFDNVTDDIDQCPNTDAGSPVDENGCAENQLDEDDDGVSNDLDQCPLTPTNETSDSQGCSPSQLDEDSDGVNDALDQCPVTPEGLDVNAEGCALSQLDTDGDTVTDDADECPLTSAGDEVNSEGCSQAQLDEDEDGINNTLDLCADTPVDETANSEGCSPSQLDTDEDGVNDALDQCSDTPEGLSVNEEGCSLVQLDTDLDGVSDAIDQCPNTPNGEAVNGNGCSLTQLDSDADGVNDAIDQCTGTTSGDTVNANGCSLSQLDSDNDGVSDALDQCPSTENGDTVNTEGCSASQVDTDSDGINDALDQCTDTLAGETVDAQGCALSQLDSDSDGVNDNLDQCAATPSGATVDLQGCSPSQLDSDNDGINDAIDQCPSTPEGQAANTDGCALAQLDTDNDGINDAQDLCAATVAGEVVDSAGCSLAQLDSDSDGINDALDQCEGTPAGETANEQGCSSSQLDTDSDGVSDALDQCPLTPTGDAVNVEGCSPDQIDSDSDGVADYLDAFPNDPSESSDIDGDGIGDNSDPDRDGDGVNNDQDAFPVDPLESSDLDGDGVGDNADVDRDGDGVDNANDAFPNDPDETSDVDGDGIGDNSDSDLDGDGVDNNLDVFPNDPTESSDLDGDGVGDNSDPDRDGDGVDNEDDYFPNDPGASSVPTVEIISPSTLITVGSSPLSISGTVNDVDATIIVNGVQIPQNSGSFDADVALEEGSNTIIVRAIDDKGNEGTATISVALDKTAPYITVASPVDGATVFTDSISIGGLVNDIVRGTISETDAVVIVNGQQATVANRSYLAENIPLVIGNNTITIGATDAVGNSAQKQITIVYQPQTSNVIELVSGQSQSAKISENLPQSLVVKLTENGQPLVDKVVVFRVIEGDGQLQPGMPDQGNGAVVQTNIDGHAQVTFKLGSRAGNGNHRVRAKAVGFDGDVEFYASAGYGEGIQMGIIAGNNQRGSIKQPLPQPFTLAVTDAGANLIPNAPVEWEVTQGGGVFANGETTYTNQTDMDGRASVSFVLGDAQGLDIQRVAAKLVGTNASSGFTVSGFVPGDPGQTSISGVVLDNQDQPIPTVTVRVDGSTRQAISDDQGQFTITEAPVGPVHLMVEGSTTTRTGEWPSLSYNIVTIPGVNNPMASPIYLVEIDTENAVYVGSEDKIITHPELPGFELDVKAGSVTFPDGAKEGYLSITRVNANKIPMPPPNGMQPQLIVTIQPHGAVFDPPARLTIPNVDAHAPLAEIEMYSYDHDLEEFVTIGLGTVSRDGSVITSNIGVGVIKAGWHCGSPPGGSGCCEQPAAEKCGECEMLEASDNCSAGTCVAAPGKEKSEQVAGDCFTALCDGSSILDLSDQPVQMPCGQCFDRNNGQCPGFCELVPDREDSSQTAGDCRRQLCDGSSFSDFGDRPPKPGGSQCHVFNPGSCSWVAGSVAAGDCLDDDNDDEDTDPGDPADPDDPDAEPEIDIDTDEDGISDKDEMALGTDPLDPNSTPVDNNNNGVPDAVDSSTTSTTTSSEQLSLIESELGDPNDCTNSKGCPTWSVNMMNLNVFVTDTPLWYDTSVGPDVEIKLSYNSQAPISGKESFGNKWSLNYGSEVEYDSENATVVLPDGRRDNYRVVNLSTNARLFPEEKGKYDHLRFYTQLYWEVVTDEGEILRYRKPAALSGVLLTEWVDIHGKSLTFDYTNSIRNPRLSQITDALGRVTTFTYGTSGLVGKVTDPFGREAKFEYDGDRNLVAITDMGGYRSVLSYDARQNIESIDKPEYGIWGFDIEPNDDGPTAFYPTGNEPLGKNYRVTITDPLDRISEYYYNATGKTGWHVRPRNYRSAVANSTTPTGVSRIYTYEESPDGWDRITSFTNENGSVEKTEYNLEGKVDSHLRSVGISNMYDYNEEDQLIREYVGINTEVTKSFEYEYLDGDAELRTLIKEPGVGTAQKKTEMDYDGNRYLKGVTVTGVGGPRTSTFTYEATGQLKTENGSRVGGANGVQDITTHEYYDCSNVFSCGERSKTTNAKGHVTEYSNYKKGGLVGTVTDPNGMVTNFEYDGLDRVVKSTQVGSGQSRVTEFEYRGTKSNLKTSTHPNGKVLAYSYDDAEQLKEVSDNLGNRTVYTLDKHGNRETEKVYGSTELQLTVNTTFDKLDRAKTINSGGSIQAFTYDREGRVITETDPNENPDTKYDYDVFGRLKITTDPYSNDTINGYDLSDNLIETTARNGAETTYDYNDFGEVIQEVSADRGTIVYTRDSAGNMSSMLDARGVKVDYTYDELNRVLTADYPDQDEDITYTYDNCLNGKGRLCQVEDPSGISSYEYDQFGNITKTVKDELGTFYTTQYQYDEVDALTEVTYPNGLIVTYQRDLLSRVTEVSAEGLGVDTVIVSNILYRADGAITSYQLGNGLTGTRTYDLQGRQQLQKLLNGGSVVFSLDHGYDSNGNVTRIDRTPDVEFDAAITNVTPDPIYDYDFLNRLVLERNRDGLVEYDYDENDNRTLIDREDKDDIYTYLSNSNRLVQLENEATLNNPAIVDGNVVSVNSSAITLDLSGNTTSEAERGFTYNDRNQVSSFNRTQVLGTTEVNQVTNYQYDSKNLRTQKQSNSVNNLYAYDQAGRLLTEYSNGNSNKTVIWLGVIPIVHIQHANDGSAEALTFLTADHLGTPRLGTDQNKNVVWQWHGDAFGTIEPNQDPDNDGNEVVIQQRFPGQYYDQESGLNYNWNRYYDSDKGRYVSSDPIGLEGGLNTYGYVSGNPLMYVDADGLRKIGRPGIPDSDGYKRAKGNAYSSVGFVIGPKYKFWNGEVNLSVGAILTVSENGAAKLREEAGVNGGLGGKNSNGSIGYNAALDIDLNSGDVFYERPELSGALGRKSGTIESGSFGFGGTTFPFGGLYLEIGVDGGKRRQSEYTHSSVRDIRNSLNCAQ